MMTDDIIKPQATSQRLDVWLWYSRLFKTRNLSSSFIKTKRIRVNHQIVKKSAYPIKQGDIISFINNTNVRIIKIKKLLKQRISAKSIHEVYDEILEK